jgi:hypothetical protein
MKKRIMAATAIVVVTLLVLAVLRARSTRELILEADGLPLAGLTANVLNVTGGSLVATSTDADGRLDLQRLPRGTAYINVELHDGAGNIRLPNTLFTLPTGGFRKVVDFRSGRTISSLTTVYADFVLFTWSVRQEETWGRGTPSDRTPADVKTEQVRLSEDEDLRHQ